MWVITGPEYPAVASTLIQSAYRNTLDAAIATGLSNCVTRDGQSPPTANIPMGGFKLTGLGLATLATDAASLANLAAGTATYVGTVGGTADVITLTPSPAITAYAAGQRFQFIASGTNTTNVTAAISGLAAKAITKNGSTALVAGDIPIGALIDVMYDGTRLQLIASISLVGFGTQIVRSKASDTSRNTTTTQTNDPDLIYAIPTAGTYAIDVLLQLGGTAPGTQGIKITTNYSGTYDTTYSNVFYHGSVNGASVNGTTGTVATTPNGGPMINVGAISTAVPVDKYHIKCILICSTTGTFGVSWAQNNSTANNTTIGKGSYMKVARLL